MIEIVCGSCGAAFGMTNEMFRQRKDSGDTWWCPNGHARVFSAPRQEEAASLRAENERLRAKLAAVSELELAAARAAVGPRRWRQLRRLFRSAP